MGSPRIPVCVGLWAERLSTVQDASSIGAFGRLGLNRLNKMSVSNSDELSSGRCYASFDILNEVASFIVRRGEPSKVE